MYLGALLPCESFGVFLFPLYASALGVFILICNFATACVPQWKAYRCMIGMGVGVGDALRMKVTRM